MLIRWFAVDQTQSVSQQHSWHLGKEGASEWLTQLWSPSLALLKYISVFKLWKSLFWDYVGLIFLEWVYNTKIRRMNGSFCHWSWCPQIYIHCSPPLQTIPTFSHPFQSSLLVWLTQILLTSIPRSLVTVPISGLHCCSWPLPIKTGQWSAQSLPKGIVWVLNTHQPWPHHVRAGFTSSCYFLCVPLHLRSLKYVVAATH